MPRRSFEDMAAAHFRAGGKAPAPPPHLDAKSKRLWVHITASKPADFFGAGSLPLLEAYVTALVMHRFYMDIWRTNPINRDAAVRPIVALNNSLSQLATKLRLAITSIDKRHGILTEKGEPEGGRVIRDVLFGGGAPRF